MPDDAAADRRGDSRRNHDGQQAKPADQGETTVGGVSLALRLRRDHVARLPQHVLEVVDVCDGCAEPRAGSHRGQAVHLTPADHLGLKSGERCAGARADVLGVVAIERRAKLWRVLRYEELANRRETYELGTIGGGERSGGEGAEQQVVLVDRGLLRLAQLGQIQAFGDQRNAGRLIDPAVIHVESADLQAVVVAQRREQSHRLVRDSGSDGSKPA